MQEQPGSVGAGSAVRIEQSTGFSREEGDGLGALLCRGLCSFIRG